MKRLLTVALLLVSGGVAYAFLGHHDPVQAEVAQASVTKGDLTETISATGTINPLRTVQVGSQVSGTVTELGADFNSIVKKDQIIAKLDPSLMKAQVDVQQAAVERQQTDINNLTVQLRNTDTDLSRTQQLFDKNLVSQQALDQAKAAESSASAALDQSKKMLVQAIANLNQAKVNLSYCTIRSPIDGVVIQRLVDVGQAVQSSMTTPQFFVLASDLNTLQLIASVDESDIGKIRPHQPVSFTVEAYPLRTFHGSVDSVRLNSVNAQNVVTYQTVVNVPNPDVALRPGMTASLQIIVDSAQNVVRVPAAALRFRPTADTYTALGATAPADDHSPAATAASGGSKPRQWSGRGEGTAPATAPLNPSADKVDELFAPFHEPVTSGRVWTWDAAAKRLAAVPVKLGISDGKNTAVISGDLVPGQSVVTGVTLPTTATTPARPAVNNPLSPSRGGGRFGR